MEKTRKGEIHVATALTENWKQKVDAVIHENL